ncbi:MAG TPA: hypothetical protein VL098_15255 [Flavipsychrobacter sp.]|nr:hypothetical protein [Flavipsychrobacter sp.]
MEIIVVIFCCYLNYSRAKSAKLSGAKWALLTFALMFVGVMIGGIALLLSFASKDAEFNRLITQIPQDQESTMSYLQGKITFLHQLFVLFCSIGGYLLVRYLLNKRMGTNGDQHQSF